LQVTLKILAVPDAQTLAYAKKCYHHAERKKFFDSQRRWLASLYRKEIEQGVVDHVEIRPAPGMGQGLYATAPFQSGDYVGTYAGILVRRKLFGRNSNDYCFRIPTTCYTPWPLMIDAERAGNAVRFVNHSDDPNLESIGIPYRGLVHILILAKGSIAAGEQLFLDYGARYWKQDGRKRL